MNQSGHTGFIGTNDCSQRCFSIHDTNQHMNMIWHYNKMIHIHPGMMLRNFKNTLTCYIPKYILFSCISKNTLFFMGAYGNKIIIGRSIVIPF